MHNAVINQVCENAKTKQKWRILYCKFTIYSTWQWHVYAISLQSLVQRLNDQNAKQVWFADDASAGGKLDGLKQW